MCKVIVAQIYILCDKKSAPRLSYELKTNEKDCCPTKDAQTALKDCIKKIADSTTNNRRKKGPLFEDNAIKDIASSFTQTLTDTVRLKEKAKSEIGDKGQSERIKVTSSM